MAKPATAPLGVGVYTPSEAALYASISSSMLTRWLFAKESRRTVFEPEVGDRENRLVSFMDFVQVLSIREIQTVHGVTLGRVRESIEYVAKKIDFSHPLALKHKLQIFRIPGRQPEIAINVGGETFLASGKQKSQGLMTPLVEPHLKDIVFEGTVGEQAGVASRYVLDRERGVGKIILDPKINFGAPTLEGTAYTAESLWDASMIEGGDEEAAKVYGVSTRKVALARKFFERLGVAA